MIWEYESEMLRWAELSWSEEALRPDLIHQARHALANRLSTIPGGLPSPQRAQFQAKKDSKFPPPELTRYSYVRDMWYITRPTNCQDKQRHRMRRAHLSSWRKN